MSYEIEDVALYDFFTANRDWQLGALMAFDECEKLSGSGTVSAFTFAEKLRTTFGLLERPTYAAGLVLHLWARRNYFEVATRGTEQGPLYRLGNLGKLTLFGNEQTAEARTRACIEARAMIHGYRAGGGLSLH